ncbi:MAG: hypothetical protein WKF43_01280 [Acidimicrobiales bacterium]
MFDGREIPGGQRERSSGLSRAVSLARPVRASTSTKPSAPDTTNQRCSRCVRRHPHQLVTTEGLFGAQQEAGRVGAEEGGRTHLAELHGHSPDRTHGAQLAGRCVEPAHVRLLELERADGDPVGMS